MPFVHFIKSFLHFIMPFLHFIVPFLHFIMWFLHIIRPFLYFIMLYLNFIMSFLHFIMVFYGCLPTNPDISTLSTAVEHELFPVFRVQTSIQISRITYRLTRYLEGDVVSPIINATDLLLSTNSAHWIQHPVASVFLYTVGNHWSVSWYY